MEPRVPSNDAAVITVRSLRKSFGDVEVLSGVDLDVARGENFVVLGRSGSGKSVLAKLVVGLLGPDSGSIRVLGSEIGDLRAPALRELRLKVGFSFQSSALYDSMTVRENLEFPLVRNRPDLGPAQVDRAVEESLDAVGLRAAIDQLSSELSGGQRKRIGIARALMLRPEIMLYDEPTAGLDPITCGEMIELIRDVRERYGTSAIVITHDLACAQRVGDRVAMLEGGRFIREGTFDEVFASPDPRVRGFHEYRFVR
jgi:phospholipid/cholesterol/gamma-HCH transport system ATP-binding protein